MIFGIKRNKKRDTKSLIGGDREHMHTHGTQKLTETLFSKLMEKPGAPGGRRVGKKYILYRTH